MFRLKPVVIILSIAALLISCRGDIQPKGSFSILIETNYHNNIFIKEADLLNYHKLKDSSSQCLGTPLEIILYNNGIQVVDEIEILDTKDEIYRLDQTQLTDPVCLNYDGSLEFLDEKIVPKKITVQEDAIVQSSAKIQDIPATVSSALDLGMADLAGNSLIDGLFEHVVLIYLDGFGYEIYEKASQMKLTPNIEDHAVVIPALTVYPPRSNVASAALLTGLYPEGSQVYRSGIRNTQAPTIFSSASKKGLTSVAIEGANAPFVIENSRFIVSDDQDQNGFSDDNTYENAMQILSAEIPRLTWIHFHGIDDSGHLYGPDSKQVYEKVAEIDEYIAEIYRLLPGSTLIIIFSDHGMHTVEGNQGRHGNLIESDMVIPIIIKTK